MLFDKNGIYLTNNDFDNDYDFAVNLINGTGGFIPDVSYEKMNNFKIYDMEEALEKGNLFPDLYDTYKSFRPRELRVNSTREKALLEIQMLDFSINDLNLYLDMHPNNEKAFRILKEYVNLCKKKKEEYSETYGPLVLDDVTDEYEWSNGVWPWEEGAM